MKIAVIQICSALDPKTNLSKIEYFIQEAKKHSQIEAVFLPEVFYSMSDGTRPTPYLIKGENEHFQAIQNLAKKQNVFLLGGTAATDVAGNVINRTYNFDPQGNFLTHYDKMHLFSVDLRGHKSQTVIDESLVYTAGNNPQMLEVNEWKIGLGICFDIRFPELFRYYFSQGANLLTAASAFTVPTGKAHWETLLRARAIENQSYVVAANQWGTHNEKMKTYGHSLVIDPWGEIVATAGDGEGYILAELELEKIEKIRGRMNVRPKYQLL